jgi:hypothetical protein
VLGGGDELALHVQILVVVAFVELPVISIVPRVGTRNGPHLIGESVLDHATQVFESDLHGSLK